MYTCSSSVSKDYYPLADEVGGDIATPPSVLLSVTNLVSVR